MILYHRTCDHGRAMLGRDGVLRPNMHPLLGVALVWLTNSRVASRDDLGLTSSMLSCDRMQYLYRVLTAPGAVPWIGSPWRASAARDVIEDLESSGVPACWWVSSTTVRVRLVGVGARVGA